ncbi:MAG: kelch repeat-containing protein [Dehalococcoidia bacterium]
MSQSTTRQQLVLFGGYDGRSITSSETWEWDGAAWTRKPVGSGPSPRAYASMAYDAARDRGVLFEGVADCRSGPACLDLSDTWTWDGSTWTQQHPAVSPPARSGANMAYHAATRSVILFGGYSVAMNQYLNDTWAWDGRTWTQQQPETSPPSRTGAAMTMDPLRGSVLLFGGLNSRAILDDTWSWNGQTWSLLPSSTHPASRVWASMAYNEATRTPSFSAARAVPFLPAMF